MPEWNDESQDLLDDLIRRLEDAWRTSGSADLAQFVPAADHPMRTTALLALIKVDQELRWKCGKGKTVAEYLAEWPELHSQSGRIAELQAAEDELRAEISTSRPAAGAGNTQDFLPPQPRAIHIRCPHCHNRVEIVEQPAAADVTCPQCGSHFTLADDETIAFDNLPSHSGRGAGGEGIQRRIAHFELMELLGQGAFGSVWKAHDTKLDRIVALKVPRRGQLLPEHVEEFLREARSAAALEHENIIPIYEAGEAEGLVYIASRYIEGHTLNDWVAAQGRRLTPQEAAKLAVVIAGAVHYAHQHGVIHRDLKPGNIMIDACGKPYIMDFGLAKRHSAEITMTVEGQILGTPAYMSPEQAKGEGFRADARSDVYSLGVILFELLTGERPFRGDVQMLLRQVAEDEAPSARKLNSRISRDLETVCAKCLEKLPARRYETAESLADDLSHFLAGEPIHARPVGRPVRLWRWCKRQPVVAGLSAAVALTLLVGMIVSASFALNWQQAASKAKENAAKADVNAAEANANAVKSQRQLALSYIDRGTNELEHGDRALGLAFLGQAYRAADGTEGNGLRHGVCSLLSAWGAIVGHPLPHADEVNDVAFSPDGTKIATASNDHTVRLWDATTGEPLGVPMRHDTGVFALAFSPDGSKLLTKSEDFSKKQFCAQWWDTTTGKPLGQPMKHRSLLFMTFSADGTKLATGSEDHTARVWDATTGKPLSQPLKHDDNVNSAVFSLDGRKVATGSYDGTARLWDATTGKPLGQPLRLGSEPYALAIGPDGTKVAIGTYHGTASLWDTATGEPLGHPMQHDGPVHAVAFSPDGMRLATASDDKTARLWDAVTGGPLGSTMKHDGPVEFVAFSPDGTKVATASWDPWPKDRAPVRGEARLWDAATGQPLGPPMKHDGWAISVAFSPDGTKVAAPSGENMARIWDLTTGEPLGSPMKHDGGVWVVSFSPDGTKLATTSGKSRFLGTFGAYESLFTGEIRLWDTATGKPLGVPMNHDGSVCAVCFNSDGTQLATASRSPGGPWAFRAGPLRGEARLWSAATGKPLGPRMQHDEHVNAVAFSRDCTKFATASWDYSREKGYAHLWNAATGQPLGQPIEHNGWVVDLAFSRDGTKFATASGDPNGKGTGEARLWDAIAGQPLCQPMRHERCVVAVAFSPDGAKVATGSYDGTARLWDTATGGPLGHPMRHDGPVHAVAFSPDGMKLATASDDKTARLWDAVTGEPLGSTMKHNGPVHCVAFSPDGTKVATVNQFAPKISEASWSYEAGEARIWDAATGKPLGMPMKPDGGVCAAMFSPDGTKIATASGNGTARLWPVPQSLPDDREWFTAYVQITSAWREDDFDATVHPISVTQMEEAWKNALKSRDWLEQQRQGATRRVQAWHESEARDNESAQRWFTAAFHLRCLCKLDPKNIKWQQRLVEAQEHPVFHGQHTPFGPAPAASDAPTLPAGGYPAPALPDGPPVPSGSLSEPARTYLPSTSGSSAAGKIPELPLSGGNGGTAITPPTPPSGPSTSGLSLPPVAPGYSPASSPPSAVAAVPLRIDVSGPTTATVGQSVPRRLTVIVDNRNLVTAGKNQQFEVQVTNQGDSAENDIVVVANIPPGSALVESGTSGPSAAIKIKKEPGLVRFSPVAELPPKAAIIYRVVVTPSQAGPISLQVEATSRRQAQPVVGEKSVEVLPAK